MSTIKDAFHLIYTLLSCVFDLSKLKHKPYQINWKKEEKNSYYYKINNIIIWFPLKGIL